MNSREKILAKLHRARQPFQDVQPLSEHLPMVVQSDLSPTALKTRFIAEATKLSCHVHHVGTDSGAIDVIRTLLGTDSHVMAWDWAHIPVNGLREALSEVQLAPMRDKDVRVGLTGVDSALASTGSIVLTSGHGKPRQASLLPNVHIAVVQSAQIIPDLETWFVQQRAQGLAHFRQNANVFVISGPSRTADIAMELVMGMHGPREVHIILMD